MVDQQETPESAPVPPAPAPAPSAVESPANPFSAASQRTADRKKIVGRAKVVVQGGPTMQGKMIDISEPGISLMMDDPIPNRKVCTLECSTFHNGQQKSFNVQALVVYNVLVSGKGYRIGFQFGPRSPAAAQTIAELLK